MSKPLAKPLATLTLTSKPFFFVFDLDETLAEVYPLFDILEDALTTRRSTAAYRALVRRVAAEGGRGILRPGIRETMQRLHDLQRKSLVDGVWIYSNNGHLRSLHFIRDVIHAFLDTGQNGRPLILECIHWNHPRRTDAPERNDKTWDSLRRFLPEGTTADHVFFVDDLDHPDLHAALGDHYLQVPPYEYHVPFDDLLDVYEEALGEATAGLAPLTQRDRDRLHRLTKPKDSITPVPEVDPVFARLMEQAFSQVEPVEAQQGGQKKRRHKRNTYKRIRNVRSRKNRRTKKGHLSRE